MAPRSYQLDNGSGFEARPARKRQRLTGPLTWYRAKGGNCHTSSTAQSYIRDRIVVEELGYLTPCWTWQRCIKNRYGWLRWDGAYYYAHRLSYMVFVGAIRAEYEVDHLCNQPTCCNPEHLEAVTKRENLARQTVLRRESLKTICKHGHDTALAGRTAKGHCKVCAAAAKLRWKRLAKATTDGLQSHDATGLAALSKSQAGGGPGWPNAAVGAVRTGHIAHDNLGPTP